MDERNRRAGGVAVARRFIKITDWRRVASISGAGFSQCAVKRKLAPGSGERRADLWTLRAKRRDFRVRPNEKRRRKRVGQRCRRGERPRASYSDSGRASAWVNQVGALHSGAGAAQCGVREQPRAVAESDGPARLAGGRPERKRSAAATVKTRRRHVPLAQRVREPVERVSFADRAEIEMEPRGV